MLPDALTKHLVKDKVERGFFMGNKTCPHCHSPVKETARFCGNCGKALPPAAPTQQLRPAAPPPPTAARQGPLPSTSSLSEWLGRFTRTAQSVGRRTSEILNEWAFTAQPYIEIDRNPFPFATDSGELSVELLGNPYLDKRKRFRFFKGRLLTCPNGHINNRTGQDVCEVCKAPLNYIWVHEYYPARLVETREQREYLRDVSTRIQGVLPQHFVVMNGVTQIVLSEMPGKFDRPLAISPPVRFGKKDIVTLVTQVGETIASLHQSKITFFDRSVFSDPLEPLGHLSSNGTAIIDLGGCDWPGSGKTLQPREDIAYLGKLLFFLATEQENYSSPVANSSGLPPNVVEVMKKAIETPEQIPSVPAFLQMLRGSPVPGRPSRPQTAGASQAVPGPRTGPPGQVPPQPAGASPTGPIITRSLRQNAGYTTHRGKVREHNEDFVGKYLLGMDQNADTSDLGLYLVADGMGGHQAGELASRAVNEVIIQQIQANQAALQTGTRISRATINLDAIAAPSEILRAAIQKGNQVLLQVRQKIGGDRGTTITAALVIGSKAYIANVGDSRTYLMRQGRLTQVTHDHSVVDALVRSGQIRPEEVRRHPQRNQVYRTMGDRPNVEIDLFTEDLVAGDRLLLCSDGLWEMVLDAQIEQMLLQSNTPQTACDRLVQAANANGGEDNVTAIVVLVE